MRALELLGKEIGMFIDRHEEKKTIVNECDTTTLLALRAELAAGGDLL
jgi:hypothetical protein